MLTSSSIHRPYTWGVEPNLPGGINPMALTFPNSSDAGKIVYSLWNGDIRTSSSPNGQLSINILSILATKKKIGRGGEGVADVQVKYDDVTTFFLNKRSVDDYTWPRRYLRRKRSTRLS